MPAQDITPSSKQPRQHKAVWGSKTKENKRRWVVSCIQESLSSGGKTFDELAEPLLKVGISLDYLSDILRDLLLYDGVLEQKQEVNDKFEEQDRVYTWRQKN